MKKIRLFVTLLISSLLITGCGNKLSDLPENPIIFQTGELNTPFEDTGYTTIENDGKVYIIYGGIKGKGLLNDISYAYGDCLGYIGDDKALRIYELKGESSDEWLIEYYVAGIMEQPAILREINTKNNENIPSSVKSFDYDFWSMTDTIAFNQLKEIFTGNIVDGTVAEKVLEVGPGLENEVVDITGDYTLYYNDEFGIATILGEEWEGYSVIVERYADDFEYSGEVIQIPRYMIKFGKQLRTEDYTVDAYTYHYGFSIVSNEDVEIIKTRPDVWSISFENDYKGKNDKYSFFETSARRGGGHEYLLQSFPNLDCKTWTAERNDADGNIHEINQADCDGYEVIDGEVTKTRKSWVEQLFPIGFLFYDI